MSIGGTTQFCSPFRILNGFAPFLTLSHHDPEFLGISKTYHVPARPLSGRASSLLLLSGGSFVANSIRDSLAARRSGLLVAATNSVPNANGLDRFDPILRGA